MPNDLPTSNFTLAVKERQLVVLIRELMIDYERLHGGPPSLAWLLTQMGER